MSLAWAAAVVAIGGALGGVLRVWLTALVDRAAGGGFPAGTLAVNVSGAALIGVVAGLAEPGAELAWLLVATGVLGSYTTVSSFALQVLALLRQRRAAAAGVYVAASLGLCLPAAALAFAMTAG